MPDSESVKSGDPFSQLYRNARLGLLALLLFCLVCLLLLLLLLLLFRFGGGGGGGGFCCCLCVCVWGGGVVIVLSVCFAFCFMYRPMHLAFSSASQHIVSNEVKDILPNCRKHPVLLLLFVCFSVVVV